MVLKAHFHRLSYNGYIKDAIIYVPGLGDHKTFGQDVAIKVWRLYGLKPYYLALGWAQPEGLDTKLNRLDTLVKQLTDKGCRVSIAGISAGASAVLIYYAGHPNIHKVIFIAGKINQPKTSPQRDSNTILILENL